MTHTATALPKSGGVTQPTEPGIVILQGHPDPSAETLCHALADAYAKGAASIGVTVKRIEVAQLDFPLLRTKADFETGASGTPEALRQAQSQLIEAQHLVIIYPLWLGTMPALLKGFIEQVFRPGVALGYGEAGFPTKMMKGKSARIIVTMGMPSLVYRLYFGAHSLRSLERNILKLTGFSPIQDTLFGGVDSATDAKKKKWFDKVSRLAEQDARAVIRSVN